MGRAAGGGTGTAAARPGGFPGYVNGPMQERICTRARVRMDARRAHERVLYHGSSRGLRSSSSRYRPGQYMVVSRARCRRVAS